MTAATYAHRIDKLAKVRERAIDRLTDDQAKRMAAAWYTSAAWDAPGGTARERLEEVTAEIWEWARQAAAEGY